MKKMLLFIGASIALSACGPRWDSGDTISENREVEDFSSVAISAPLDVIIKVQPGMKAQMSIKGYPDILKKIKTEVSNGRLRIYTEDKHWGLNFDEDPKVAIVVNALSSLRLSGAADVDVEGNITGESFSLDVSGAGDVKIQELNIDKLSVDAAGAADVSIKKGTARLAEYDFSGAGDLKAYGLKSEDVRASVSGAGDVKVSVSNSLDASISGVGSVRYKGHPSVNKSVSGIGSVSDAN